ncbi:MAG: alpha/beta fold hydrolase [Saprospiraceae bacterium]|nr:alpha/beta fold hydrolase [Saprospiraceae bacterium]
MKNAFYDVSLFPFKGKRITIDGNNIFYVDEGKGQIILFSHPPVASSFMYREFIKLLSAHYRCIAFDYPGFGLSEAAKDYHYNIISQANFLKKFIQQLNLKDVIVLGHDTGGPSAFLVALEQPELFKALILNDTIVFPVSEYPRIDKMLGFVGSTFFQNFNAWTNLIINATYRFGIRNRRLSRAERRQYRQLFDTYNKRKRITQLLYSLKSNEPAMLQIKNAFQKQLNTKPLLLIYGKKDPVNELGIPQRIQQMTQNASLHLIANEGHFPHESAAEEMCTIIHSWIQRHL